MKIRSLLVAIYEKINKTVSYTVVDHGLFPQLKIMSAKDTASYILEKKCSVARFGDGEFDLIFFTADEGYQSRSEELSEELKRVLKNGSPDLLICVPRYINSVKGVKPRVAEFWKWYLWVGGKKKKIIQLLKQNPGLNYRFGDTQVTRPFDNEDKEGMLNYFSYMKKIWSGENLLIIEGEQTRMGVGNDLFDNVKSIKRVLAPAVNAFGCVNEIRNFVYENYNNELVLLALGPTATVLASDFSKKGIRALDLGHLDIEYEWYLCGTEQKVSIPGKWVNESLDGKVYTVCDDEQYNKQIISRIGC